MTNNYISKLRGKTNNKLCKKHFFVSVKILIEIFAFNFLNNM
jgi:hypothetical protein